MQKDDVIYRQAAIDIAKKLLDYYGTNDISKGFADYTAEQFMNRVPSAQPDLSEHSAWFRIGETLVDESKMYITAEQAVDKIRGYMIRMKKPERELELDGTESNIEILSELRAQFNCFDKVEEPVYRALSDAICALSAQPEYEEVTPRQLNDFMESGGLYEWMDWFQRAQFLNEMGFVICRKKKQWMT